VVVLSIFSRIEPYWSPQYSVNCGEPGSGGGFTGPELAPPPAHSPRTWLVTQVRRPRADHRFHQRVPGIVTCRQRPTRSSTNRNVSRLPRIFASVHQRKATDIIGCRVGVVTYGLDVRPLGTQVTSM
jgi:hypothetical protein